MNDLDLLFQEVKSYLNFTWEDSAKDNRVYGYLVSSIQYLEEVAGTSLNFETDYLAKDLLFNRVLYMDSSALDDFQRNYNGLLEELKIKYAVLGDENAN